MELSRLQTSRDEFAKKHVALCGAVDIPIPGESEPEAVNSSTYGLEEKLQRERFKVASLRKRTECQQAVLDSVQQDVPTAKKRVSRRVL